MIEWKGIAIAGIWLGVSLAGLGKRDITLAAMAAGFATLAVVLS